MELNDTHIRYLLTIYRLSQNNQAVLSKDIAHCLSVQRPSVAQMLTVLMDKGLVLKERYGKVSLTDRGYFTARQLAGQAEALSEMMQSRLSLPEIDAWRAACAAVCSLRREQTIAIRFA